MSFQIMLDKPSQLIKKATMLMSGALFLWLIRTSEGGKETELQRGGNNGQPQMQVKANVVSFLSRIF